MALLAQLGQFRTPMAVAQATTEEDLRRLARQLSTTCTVPEQHMLGGLTVLVQGVWYRRCPTIAQNCLKTVLQNQTLDAAVQALAAWALGFLRLPAAGPLLSEVAASPPPSPVAQAAREALLYLEDAVAPESEAEAA